MSRRRLRRSPHEPVAEPRALTPRRWIALLLAPLAGAAIAIAATLGASALAPAAKLRTTAVGVSLREYRLTPYRARVLPGRVRFNIENFGEDAHDLRVIGPGSSRSIRATSPELKAGARHTLQVMLRTRGLYRLICTIGDHEQRGMVARLRVVRKL
jgi:plastocyanin